MKIADLDSETRSVIVLAHIVSYRPTEENLLRLRATVRAFDKKHEVERTHNLLRAIFDEPYEYGGNHTVAECECNPFEEM